MPIIKSAKKRVKTARKATIRNSKTKRGLKLALKVLRSKPSSSTHSKAQSNIDKAVKKGVVSKHKASRLKAKAALNAKSNGVKLAKSPAKTTPVKKTAPKKAVPKKSK